MPFKETDCLKCAWKPDDDNVFELVRKALDEQSYEHHWQILAYLSERFKLARLGAAVQAGQIACCCGCSEFWLSPTETNRFIEET